MWREGEKGKADGGRGGEGKEVRWGKVGRQGKVR